ncbi:uncharacterized protein LOC141674870 [Apium graveolens]|uniref:uncharacterized protein LOC141674870 n=1 Tax=Apium graveolens TaxID=4045 RepID=UPI003D7A8912
MVRRNSSSSISKFAIYQGFNSVVSDEAILAANFKNNNGPSTEELTGFNMEERPRCQHGASYPLSMIILSWNCRGLGSPRTVRVPCDLVKSHKPDVLFLTETISFANKNEELRIKLGFAHCFTVDRVGRSGGLALFWKNNMDCEVTGFSRNHINANFSNNGTAVWFLSCFYGFLERARRQSSWDLICTLEGMTQLPWVIIGDFNDLLSELDFHKETKDYWLSLPAAHILPKLISVSNFMAHWGKNCFHKFRDKVKKQKELLAKLVNHFDNEEGDDNTKFFHASASSRKKTNRIPFLESDSGEQVANMDEFSEEDGCVSDTHNQLLVAELSFQEFTKVVKQMHPDKASGPDGLNPAFFQQFWPILGNEVYTCCRDWLKLNSFPANLNDTNVVLIPKKENACRMRDFRPIALCNVLYKILSKVLANRLKGILPHIISKNQAAFVPDRSINDNVLIVFELIRHMKKSGRGSEGDVAIKLDVSKAYDRVDWRFLKKRLSRALSKVAAEEVIHGIKVTSSTPAISHLLFADDSFLFFKANTVETEAIKSILDSYATVSGQCINYQKSGIFFSSNVKANTQTEILTLLGVHNDLQNNMYLGLPSLVRRSKKRVFGFIKERLWKLIQGWKAKKMWLLLFPPFSGSSDRKGINWVAWNGMSMSKCHGRLAFRNLYGYNVTLMAKHIERKWDRDKVLSIFSPSDAATILATNIPTLLAVDRLAWSRTTNGHYSVKFGYQMWHDRNIGVGLVTQSSG